MSKLDHAMALVAAFEEAVSAHADFEAAGWESEDRRRVQRNLKKARDDLNGFLEREFGKKSSR